MRKIHSVPVACIHFGARRRYPAMKSMLAPQPEEPGRGRDPAQAHADEFLLGEAEADVHEVGGGGFDAFDERAPLRGVAVEAHRRAPGAHDLQARVAGFEDLRGAFGRAHGAVRGAAQERHAQAADGRGVGEGPDQVRARHALRQRVPGHFRGPHEGRAVGDHEVGGVDDGAQFQALPDRGDDVDVRGDDLAAAPGFERVEHAVHRLGFGDRIDADAAQTHPFRGRCGR